MTFVGLSGIALSFLAFFWFSPRTDNTRLALFAMISMLHIIAAYIYYLYVQTNDADTKLYYYDPFGFFGEGFGLSTVFVVWLTQSMKLAFGGTYLDYFMLYQVLGIWGLALVFRSMDEAAMALNVDLPPVAYALMFLPGMYFWTSAIGKDAPLFLACALAVWSMFSIRTRWFWFGVAIAIMILFRIHIALITMAALAIALVSGRGVPIAARILLGAIATVSAVYLFATLQSELSVDLSSVGSIAGYVEKQTGLATQGVDDTLARSSFFVKAFSLLYRPLFVDADSLFGLVASLQNLVIIAFTFLFIRNFRLWIELIRGSLAIRFATIHFVSLYLLLSFIYYNVGLGLRQREMATPALLLVFVTMWMVGQLRKQSANSVRLPSLATA
jgi:hypothetical protein